MRVEAVEKLLRNKGSMVEMRAAISSNWLDSKRLVHAGLVEEQQAQSKRILHGLLRTTPSSSAPAV